MNSYNYRVITKEGREKKGSIDAESREKAAHSLKSEGNTILSLEQGNIFTRDISFGGKKVKSRDLSVFCRQFNSLLRAGVSIVTSLEMLADQTENKRMKHAILNVRDNVEKGDTLAGAMRREQKVFPPLLVSMLEAGEASGNVEVSLARMAEHFEKDTKIKGMLKKSMMYPIILLCVALVVVIVMVTVVIPNFAKMFESMDSELPLITRIMLAVSDFIVNYWYLLILGIGAIIGAFIWYKKTPHGARTLARIGLKIPVFGKLQSKTAAARFARTFSTMLSSGMPMVEAMNMTAKTMDNVLYADALHDAAMQIQRGMSISQPLKASGLFPPLIIHMVGIGEETGNLEEMLDNSAKYYDEEVEMTTQQVMALMEPLIIVVMAAVVILLLAAIYGPVTQMYNDLSNI